MSAGQVQAEIWAITATGVLCRRHGITPDNPAGTGWSHGIGVSDILSQIYFIYLNGRGTQRIKQAEFSCS